MKAEGWEELVVDYNLITLISDEISNTFKLIDCRDLELSDLSVFKSVVAISSNFVYINCTFFLVMGSSLFWYLILDKKIWMTFIDYMHLLSWNEVMRDLLSRR